MSETTESPEPAAREKLVAVLEHWDGVQLIEPGWTVEYDAGDGAYRITFMARPNPFPSTGTYKRYSMNEAEFCRYVQGVVDMAPEHANWAARRLAEDSREEVQWP